MPASSTVSTARGIMSDFARRTGLTSSSPPQRYLWTDAFAVCTFLELYRQTQDEACRDLAVRLIDQVHHTLGRHRDDDSRSGWISGLDDEEGERHPTAGGLRIGKPRGERGPGEPRDPRAEWDRDGQYYHYLTKWMEALIRAGTVVEEPAYIGWAVELARAAHAGFTYGPATDGPKQMYWKMSIDLSRPLVSSMGRHDPLDGFITYSEVQAAAAPFSNEAWDLHAETGEMAAICEGRRWATEDSLGIGGLLTGAFTLAKLIEEGHLQRSDLLEQLLDDAARSLEEYAALFDSSEPAALRLAFRELGLSIGLAAVEHLQDVASGNSIAPGEGAASKVEVLAQHVPLREDIETFWLDPANREVDSWTAHRDINAVMLATSLLPGGYLGT